MKKNILTLLMLAFLVFVLIGTVTVNANASEFELRFITRTNPYQTFRQRTFKDYVEKMSDGRIEVLFFPRTVVAPGGMLDSVELIRTGEFHMAGPNDSGIAGFYPEIQAVNIPFLISNWFVGAVFLDPDQSPYTERIARDIYERSNKEIRLLGTNINSMRNLFTSVPIRTPDDVANNSLKIRVQEIPVTIDMWEKLGASTIGTPAADRYMAVATGMIDALEGGISSVRSTGAMEILDHITLTNHQMSIDLLIINEDFYQSLPEDLQQVVRDGAQYAVWVSTATRAFTDVSSLEELQDTGEIRRIIGLTEEEIQQWREIAIPAVRGFLEEEISSEYIDFIIETAEQAQEKVNEKSRILLKAID